MSTHPLSAIAYARSGDKGASANIGVIAYTVAGYEHLCEVLTAEQVQAFFASTGVQSVVRYELPNLAALNFVLHGALGEGGSQSLRIDAQGKSLGQWLLAMEIEIPEEHLAAAREHHS